MEAVITVEDAHFTGKGKGKATTRATGRRTSRQTAQTGQAPPDAATPAPPRARLLFACETLTERHNRIMKGMFHNNPYITKDEPFLPRFGPSPVVTSHLLTATAASHENLQYTPDTIGDLQMQDAMDAWEIAEARLSVAQSRRGAYLDRGETTAGIAESQRAVSEANLEIGLAQQLADDVRGRVERVRLAGNGDGDAEMAEGDGDAVAVGEAVEQDGGEDMAGVVRDDEGV
jgi:hypothetical protein